MRFLVDTHLLIWMAGDPTQLSEEARKLFVDPDNLLVFSALSIWEVAIKRAQNKPEFRTEPVPFEAGLRANGVSHLPFESRHGIAAANLPPIHKDPFDRGLIGQAIAEDLVLLTSDSILIRYSEQVRLV